MLYSFFSLFSSITGKRRTLEDGLEQGFFFLSEVWEGKVKRKTIFKKKKREGRRKEEKRKKRYTRGGSWEERNLGKVIRSHRSKETREKESFETPVGHG